VKLARSCCGERRFERHALYSVPYHQLLPCTYPLVYLSSSPLPVLLISFSWMLMVALRYCVHVYPGVHLLTIGRNDFLTRTAVTSKYVPSFLQPILSVPTPTPPLPMPRQNCYSRTISCLTVCSHFIIRSHSLVTS
jgi:hypothetical protein